MLSGSPQGGLSVRIHKGNISRIMHCVRACVRARACVRDGVITIQI